VTLYDGGTAFYALSSEVAAVDKLIIVDAVNGDQPPGTMYRFTLQDIERGAERTGVSFSLHDIGVIESLRLERLVDRIPEQVVFIGIEPERVELSMDLSPRIASRLPALVQAILGELEPHAVREPNKEDN
jgi:hydrogenase maturation protease